MRVIYDTELRSEVDLKSRGLDIYARHPSTEMLCATVATDNFIGTASFVPSSDGRDELERQMRDAGLNVVAPDTLIATLRAADVVVASNSPFDYAVTRHVLGVDIPKERWSCTMARCMRHGLPGSLDAGAKVLGLPEGKDKEGNRLSKQVWKPRPTWSRWQAMTPAERTAAKKPDAGPKWFETADKLARNASYNCADVRVSRLLDKAIPELEPDEREIWLHVWNMNERGVPVDRQMIEGAIAISDEAIADVTARIRHYTGGRVSSLKAPRQLVEWAALYGADQPSWAKDEVTAMLANPKLPEPVRVVAQARQEASRGSVAKFETAANFINERDRICHQIVYAGTSTLRLAGRGVQPLNLPRPKIEADKSAANADVKAGRSVRVPEWKLRYDPERALAAIRSGNLTVLREMGDSEEILSDNIRAMIVAPAGKKLVSPDLSAIEARGVFWISDCYKALDAYRKGEDLYCQLASTIVGFPVNKKEHPEQRQLGKVGILQCGYGSGATRVSEANKIEMDLAQQIVTAYRTDYVEVKRTWYELENAAIEAIRNPGFAINCCRDRVCFVYENGWLRMRRPSGTWMYLPDAGIASEFDDEHIYYHTWVKGGWYPERVWGGVLINFVVQGFCRDLMYFAEMQIARDPRYELVLQCYDSLTALVDERDADELNANMLRVMTTPPPWAHDMPLAAEGKPKVRYA